MVCHTESEDDGILLIGEHEPKARRAETCVFHCYPKYLTAGRRGHKLGGMTRCPGISTRCAFGLSIPHKMVRRHYKASLRGTFSHHFPDTLAITAGDAYSYYHTLLPSFQFFLRSS